MRFIIDKAFLLEESLVKMHLRSSAWRAASTTEVQRKSTTEPPNGKQEPFCCETANSICDPANLLLMNKGQTLSKELLRWSREYLNLTIAIVFCKYLPKNNRFVSFSNVWIHCSWAKSLCVSLVWYFHFYYFHLAGLLAQESLIRLIWMDLINWTQCWSFTLRLVVSNRDSLLGRFY